MDLTGLDQQRTKPSPYPKRVERKHQAHSPRYGAVMTPQAPVGRVHKHRRIHLHVEPTVCHTSTRKHKRMGFIGLDDAELEILIERGT